MRSKQSDSRKDRKLFSNLLKKSFIPQRHSIHGMMEEENVVRPHQEMASLTLDEKKYLLAVERGDIASVRR